jgi:hypothetical protein
MISHVGIGQNMKYKQTGMTLTEYVGKIALKLSIFKFLTRIKLKNQKKQEEGWKMIQDDRKVTVEINNLLQMFNRAGIYSDVDVSKGKRKLTVYTMVKVKDRLEARSISFVFKNGKFYDIETDLHDNCTGLIEDCTDMGDIK